MDKRRVPVLVRDVVRNMEIVEHAWEYDNLLLAKEALTLVESEIVAIRQLLEKAAPETSKAHPSH